MVFVVLGNYLNDDATPSELLIKRLNLTIDAMNKFHPDKIILSGGIANLNAKVSEADVMYDYLIKKGVNADILIKEGKSLSTKENALYSMTIIEELCLDEIVIISSIEHFTIYSYNVLKYFKDVETKPHTYMIYTY